MFRSQTQRGMLTIFFSCGSKPLALWETHIKNGYIQKLVDPEIKSTVYEISGLNVSTTYMTCPKGRAVLGISMPFLVLVVKNLKKYFSFEVTILDETGMRRRFRASNFQSTTSIEFLSTVMPISLTDGWNQIQFNLAEFTKRAYKKQYLETQNLKVNANIRIRRIYFAERLLPEDQLPPEYKIFFPLAYKVKQKTTIESKIQESLVTEERKGSKEVVRTESRGSIHSKRASQQKLEQMERPAKAPAVAPAKALAKPQAKALAKVPVEAPAEARSEPPAEGPAEDMLPEGKEKEENIGAEAEEILEGEQNEIIKAGSEAAVAEGEKVLTAEKTEEGEGKDVEDNVEPLETTAAMPESEPTPEGEAEADVNMAPEAAPGIVAPSET